MSEVLPHKKQTGRSGTSRSYRSAVTDLDFAIGASPVVVHLADGSSGRGTCLGCHDTPCILLGVSDSILPEAITEFPGDPARDVCPTGAILWDDTAHAPAISKACVGCGLCVVRCPYGAVSISAKGAARIESTDPDRLTVPPKDSSIGSSQHPTPRRSGRLGPTYPKLVERLPETVTALTDGDRSQFVRNLMLACGVACRVRRRGDTNVRMDGVLGLADGRIGVLEIELSSAPLESPRALLEDIAVLHSRYSLQVETIDPVSVVLALPNARSEYYQVISDIEKVLGIRCRTVTIGAILAVLWHFQTFVAFRDDLFTTSPGTTDLAPPIRKLVSAEIPVVEPYPRSFRPAK